MNKIHIRFAWALSLLLVLAVPVLYWLANSSNQRTLTVAGTSDNLEARSWQDWVGNCDAWAIRWKLS